MEFINKLRNVKEHGKEAAHRALERARESGLSLERHLRQKMRIYPPTAASAGEAGHNGQADMNAAETASPPEPIISIEGRDIEEQPRERKIA